MAARTSGGRSVDVRDDELENALKNEGSMSDQYNLNDGSMMSFRDERDALGEKLNVPPGAYYGVQTLRAAREFPDQRPARAPRPGHRHRPREEGRGARRTPASAASTPRTARAIVAAADEVLAGALRDQFIVDVYQAGAGTSHNMNANEVHRQPRRRDARRASRHLPARAPERPRQHGTVDQRRVPDRDPAGAARRRRPARGRRAASSPTASATRPTSSPTS